VLGSLAQIGYDAEWHCIPASALGAPHRRDRIWIVAYPARLQPGWTEQRSFRERIGSGGQPQSMVYPDSGGLARSKVCSKQQGRAETERTSQVRSRCAVAVADEHAGQQRRPGGASQDTGGRDADRGVVGSHDLGDPHQPRLEIRFDGHAGQQPAIERTGWWEFEPDVGRVAHGVPARVDRLRALGNAVVPQIPEAIAYAILKAD
jgi:DNA (cytosine-5)-methyltransferase 1